MQAPVASPRAGLSWPLLYLRRLVVLALYVAAAFALWQIAVKPLLPDRAAPPAEAQTVPRPASAPARILAWAWDLHLWHLTPGSERGARPAAAPKPVPQWYWEWRKWRRSLAA